MKILVLNGSPRKNGNTYNLAAAFKKGAEKNNDVELISVCDYSINPCKGCDYCFTSEGNNCVLNDDIKIIYDKMKEAEVVVVASPVYFYGISAQLKAVTDRFHTPMRNSFNTKKLGLILVGAAKIPELFDSVITQYELVLKFFKLDDIGKVLISGVKDIGDLSDSDLKRAYELGELL